MGSSAISLGQWGVANIWQNGTYEIYSGNMPQAAAVAFRSQYQQGQIDRGLPQVLK